MSALDPDRDEARERARRRLEARRARMRGQVRPQRSNGAREGASALARAAAAAVGRLGPKGLAAAGGALIVALVLIVVLVVRGCSGSPESVSAPAPEGEQPVEPTVEPEPEPADEAALAAILGDELAASLVQASEAGGDVAWIAAHPEAFAVDGEAVQRKLLKLAAEEPQAVPFVRSFPDRYPADAAEPCDAPAQGEVPRLYQWDVRWGSTVYSSTAFALTGCCPTSLSMVYQGLTGKGDLSPYDMGQRAREGGYETEFDGTDQTFLVAEAPSLGLSCEQIAVDADALRTALEAGKVVICNVGPGDFTEGGHFFVITGLDDEGRLAINDPYSAERSDRAWDVDQVISQTMGLYAYSAA